jgi:hypothetical protein
VTGSRLRLTLVLAGLALGGLVLLAWTQDWIVVYLEDTRIVVSGQQAAPALSALALSALALSGALTIAGRVLRVVLGVIEAAIGAVVAVTAAVAIADPVTASASAITAATAVAGPESIAALVLSVDVWLWPRVALVLGVLLGAAGLAVGVTAGRWPGASRRYRAERDTSPTSAGTWDALSEGDDPTSR